MASTSNQDARSSFSNFGSYVTLAAPGEAIVTTYPRNHYAITWGTSFSTPYVAGTVALMQSLRKQKVEVVRQDLQNGTDAASTSGIGAGRLNVYRSVANTLR